MMHEKSKHKINYLLFAAAILLTILIVRFVVASFISPNPYKEHGALSVKDGQLVDEKGKPFQLKGVSTHGINWYPQYINRRSFKTLRDKWGVNVIRLAVYTRGYNAYLDGGDIIQLESVIDHGVRYCSELGMYCIIDWHTLKDYNPDMTEKEAIDFFTKMSERYGEKGNVLYEICNEPSHGTTWGQIKSYARKILPVIREKAPNSIVLIGTPNWCQDIDKAAADPLTGQDNIMYTCHFYAASHKDRERSKLNKALSLNCPVFITELGISRADGNGEVDTASGNEWKKIINAHKLSYCAWNLSNKDESCALIKPDVKKLSGWKTKDLSKSGKWVRKLIKGYIFP